MKTMSSHPDLPAMLSRMVDGSITAEEFDRLERILLDDPAARAAYHEHIRVHAMLYWRWNQARSESSDGPTATDGILPSQAVVFPPGGVDLESDFSNLPVPDLSPLSPSFVGGPVFSYTVASIVLCLMLLSAWVYKVNLTQAPDNTAKTNYKQQPVFVAHVTGMKECRWANREYAGSISFSITRGRTFSLESGLLEITYRSGAKVILEGPCEYTVDSDISGRLQLGRLVARVEKRGGEREERGEESDGLADLAASAKPRVTNSQYPAPSPQSPLFSVTTPMAVVTDLGTEFGVEVAENGDTVSHVFQGVVEVRAISAHTVYEGVELPKATRLTVGQTARVKQNGSGESTPVTKVAGDQPVFVRRLYAPPKQLDLLDIVAGGDGRGVHRERGIDPATGKQDSYFLRDRRTAQRQYTPVRWNRFVDGVFIPMYGDAPPGTQLDSAGHAYDGFAIFKYKSAPMRRTVGSVWARAADINEINKSKNRWFWVYTMGAGEQFMPERKGLLCTRANVGITFDLKALRTAHEGARPSLFRAVAGLADASEIMADKNPVGMADLWVFVDGKLKQQRLKLQSQDGPVKINVELGPSDRFLTLVTTDSANGSNFDWVVWGDPVLEMVLNSHDGQSETHTLQSPDGTKQ